MVEQEKAKTATDGVIKIRLQPAPNKYIDKKWMVTIQPYGNHKSPFKVLFGRVGYTDQLIKEDKDRKDRYIDRHDNEERFWNMADQSNLKTASYWSRYLLWNHHDMELNIKEIEEKSGVQIQYSKAAAKKYLKQLSKVVK